MRTAAIFALLTVFFGFVSFFLLDNQSPLDTEALMADLDSEGINTQAGTIAYIEESIELGTLPEYVDYQNLLLVGVFFSGAVFSLLSSVQILIDKLFFKKFYENPRYPVAYRRAGLVIAGIDSLVLLRIFLGFDLIIAGTIIVLLMIIEGFLTFGAKNLEQSENSKDEVPTKEAEDKV
ncbi:hypothetical protein GF389_00040 [Candidatus Dojkabacteria bacterium]|nr:hypothetical protein [Candidatus Dojkabacteria bacterium]